MLDDRFIEWREEPGKLRKAEYRRPPHRPDFSDVFRFIERAFFRLGPMAQPRPAPEEPAMVSHAAKTIETHPYAIVVAGKVCGVFTRGDEALRRARKMGPHAEVWHIGHGWRAVEGSECFVVRADRARGKSAHLSGTTLRTVRAFTPTALTRHLVWTAKGGFTAV